MELFYYCLSAQKEEAPRSYNHSYMPAQSPIDYDEKPEKTMIPDSEEEEEEEDIPAEEVPVSSLHEVDGYIKLEEEEEEAPSPEPEPGVPEMIEPEHGVNLLRRNNSRKFKTPSFKWKKKKKNREPEPYLAPPSPSAPELSATEDLVDVTVDENVEVEPAVEEEVADKVSVDSLNAKLQEKEEELNTAAASNDAEAERLAKDAEFFKERLREAEELLSKYKTDNMMLHQRVEMAERDRGAMEHGNFLELEKVREEYQAKLNELAQYPEKLSSAEARFQHAEAQTEALQSQLAEKNQTVEELQKKIDAFQGQIGKLKEKIHAVNEDNIELSNKSQSHERKVLEADLHNKNLMDLVSKKDEAVESHQVRSRGAASSTESTVGALRDEIQAEREKNGPTLLSGYSSNFPHFPTSANFPLTSSHSTDFKFSNELLDKDKSLTSRPRHTVNTRTSPSHQGVGNLNQYHSSSPLTGPYDSCDPRLLDSYILSRLHFEEFLRSQTDLFHQMLVEREKALSVKSDSVAATPRERLDRAGSSQSEIIPHYSTPWKVGSARSDHNLLNPPRLRDISDNPEFEGAGSSFLHSSHPKSRDISELPTQRYFDKSNSNMVRTSSLTELEHLVDNCIMPEEVTREQTPPPPFIRVQRQHPATNQSQSRGAESQYPVVPRGRAVSPDEDSDEKHQMMLGGVLSMPHACKYVDDRTTQKPNGNHFQNGHDSSDSNPVDKTKSKSSLFSWTKGSKNKTKSKGKKNTTPVAAT